MKNLKVLTILLVLLIPLSSFGSSELTHIFKLYSNKNTVLNFKQISFNAMSGSKIVKAGKLTIETKKSMIFDYKNERVIVNDFEAVDYSNGKKYVYKLSGFNKVLFLLFLGRERIENLFKVRKKNGKYILVPKYKSNIDKIYVGLGTNGQIDSLTIVDIYSNRTIYKFYAVDSKRTQSGN